ncbi:hypothetical protein GCM10007925_17100 [Sphingomonas astaxanthinifaciens DSM 22298]|uniref:Uncharacterized protein n=1 Tax=Sphingomonas astaxanthinifaciens DSM 22298 TaxID=1123267 RepID=A0ABQ5Z8U6_9SPHN|nr:hypothetical protein GCM10007925_17100 [Sphingomonas astaxanthinifaciens DSM 22298]
MSCSPIAPVILATRKVGRSRSSPRRSGGRGTAMLKDTVVDSNAAASTSWGRRLRRRMKVSNTRFCLLAGCAWITVARVGRRITLPPTPAKVKKRLHVPAKGGKG